MSDEVEDAGESGGAPVVSVKVTDIFGLSKPLQKMIEYACKGCGIAFKPTQMRREAKANADSIRILADAATDVRHLPVEIGYMGESVQLRFDKPEQEIAPLSIEQRAAQCSAAKQIREQENVEAILGVAAAELENETDVPDEAPDEDWANRFFNYAEDVSSEQMRDLWGRILAGKIKRPESYGLRTLDFLRSMSKGEAEAFSKAARYVVRDGQGKAFLLTPMIGAGKAIEFDLTLLLGEIGLLAEESNLQMEMTIQPGASVVLFAGSEAVIVTGKEKETKRSLAARPFTRIGRELLELAVPITDPSVLKELVVQLHSEACDVTSGTVIQRLANGQIQLANTRTYTKDDVAELRKP